MAEGAHPFFHTQQQSQPEGMDMHSSARHQGPSALNSHVSEANMFAPRDTHIANQYQGGQSSPRVQMQNQVPASQDPNLPTPAGKRTKTSRACDQCRAKKVG